LDSSDLLARFIIDKGMFGINEKRGQKPNCSPGGGKFSSFAGGPQGQEELMAI